MAGSGNVFGIGTGVAIAFWVKQKGHKGKAKLKYHAAPAGTGEDKLSWLLGLSLDGGDWQSLAQREDAAWLEVPEESTTEFLALADPRTKDREDSLRDRAIFKMYSLGISTNRDDWLYDYKKETVARKARLLIERFNASAVRKGIWPDTLKWSETLKRRKLAGRTEPFSNGRVQRAAYRPFSTQWLYRSNLFIDRPGSAEAAFPSGKDNIAICTAWGRRGGFSCLSTKVLPSLDWYVPDANQYYARYRYAKSGEQIDNVTDWSMEQFQKHYGKKVGVTKDRIFAYCYAILHDPLYREKYALNLKGVFPRIPFYPDFARWATWGEALLKLHVHYERAKAFKLTRTDTPSRKRAAGTHPKPKLKSNPDTGSIVVDEDTQLSGMPPAAWTYRLGNRSAIDWVLDQHKEKTPRDPTIREKFNTYRFADYKENMIQLLAKVVTVSVETVHITEAMRALNRSDWA